MPMNYSLVIEPFDCWGFDLMGPFPLSHKYTHILVVVDYVTKWVIRPKRIYISACSIIFWVTLLYVLLHFYIILHIFGLTY